MSDLTLRGAMLVAAAQRNVSYLGRKALGVLADEIERLTAQVAALQDEVNTKLACVQTLERELAGARNRQSCDNGQPWVCHALATARSELAETKDQRSSLLATNYDLRKERDSLIDDLARALVLLEKNGLSIELTNSWIKVFRTTP